MNIFNVKWGIHIYVFLLLEQQNISFETLQFFQISSGKLFRKAPGITPHVYQIIYSSNLDDSQE